MTRATNTYKTIKNIRVTTRNHPHKQLHVNISRVTNNINIKNFVTNFHVKTSNTTKNYKYNLLPYIVLLLKLSLLLPLLLLLSCRSPSPSTIRRLSVHSIRC